MRRRLTQPLSQRSTNGGPQLYRPHRSDRPALALDSLKGLFLLLVLPSLLNLRSRSLVRGTVLVLAAFGIALLFTDFPNNRPTPLLLIPALIAVVGLVDHVRCMRSRWSWYHGGVLLLIYMDLMVLSMIAFFLLYPSMAWVVSAH